MNLVQKLKTLCFILISISSSLSMAESISGFDLMNKLGIGYTTTKDYLNELEYRRDKKVVCRSAGPTPFLSADRKTHFCLFTYVQCVTVPKESRPDQITFSGSEGYSTSGLCQVDAAHRTCENVHPAFCISQVGGPAEAFRVGNPPYNKFYMQSNPDKSAPGPLYNLDLVPIEADGSLSPVK